MSPQSPEAMLDAMTSPEQRPNILWICTDQQRWDTLGCSGNPIVRTPVIDALAAAGVHCITGICQATVCTPSRASFMTGRYPRTTGCRANGQALAGDEVLVSRMFRDAGYLCALTGKQHLAPCHPTACSHTERRGDDGYHRFDWSHHPCWHPSNDVPGNRYSSWRREHGMTRVPTRHADTPHVQWGVPVREHQTTWCIDRAIAAIDDARCAGRPWFQSINLFDPHHPFDPPEAYLAPYLERLDRIPLPVDRGGAAKTPWEAIDRVKAYGGKAMPGHLADHEHRLIRAACWAMCDLIDAQVGRLLDHLRTIGQFERTVIIFTSDHGELLGDHGMYLKGPHFYEQSVRVPLILHGPGLPRMTVAEPVELIDLAPTVCDLAGIPRHPGMQGLSLLPRLRGETATHRDDAYCEFLDANFSYDPSPWGTMLRTRTHKVVRFHGRDRASSQGLLFDLVEDPDETTDRWNDPGYAAVRADLTERLCDRIALTADPLPLKESPW